METYNSDIRNEQQQIERSFAEITQKDLTGADSARAIWRRSSSSLLSWADLLKSDRVLIISSAGSGKTFECRVQQRRLWDAGEPAFMLELAELAINGIELQLSPEEEKRLEQWRVSQSSIATFFLDSIDELKLTQGSFKTALIRLRKTIDGQLFRARIIITSRPVPFERELVDALLPVPSRPKRAFAADEFADIAMGSRVNEERDDQLISKRAVELLPLSDEQIVLFSSGQGVDDPEDFLADIHRRSAIEFAERPQDLIELCVGWRERHRISSHQVQIASAVETKLRPRTDRRERVELSPDRAYEGASRLALAAMMMRRLTFRHGPEVDVGGPPGTAIDPADILHDWTADECKTLLERPLFGFASYGRVRFHHRSVLEYLAARRLGHHLATGKPIAAVKRLLFAGTAQGDEVVRPTMRPVAAWLALENDSIFADVVNRDPTVMLDFGDPGSLSDCQKARVLSTYVLRYGSGGWRGLQVPTIQIRRFASPGLAPLVRELWPKVENVEVRQLLLDLIGAARMGTCADLAADDALSLEKPIELRISALDALIEMSNPRLQDVVKSLENDVGTWSMEISRAAVARLFPDNITVRSLLTMLARLSDKRNSVGYLTYHLPQKIAHLDGGPDLDALVQGLSALVGEGVAWMPEWPHYSSRRAFLLPALAAACVRRMSVGPFVPDVAEAVALTLRLAEQIDENDQHVKALRLQVDELGADHRAMLFWTEDRFRQLHHPESDPASRFWEAARRGPIQLDSKQDTAWLYTVLKDAARPISERAMVLDALLCHVWDEQSTLDEHIRRVRAAAADSAELVARADRLLAPTMPDPEHVALEAGWKERKRQQAEQKTKDHKSWTDFWSKLASDPEAAFASEQAAVTTWNLWRVMSQSGQESRSSGWNRRFLEAQFGVSLADKMRKALHPIWRGDQPTLWSEREPGKRGTYLTRWQLGLAALAAEAEDRAWATKLTADEARLACRYVPIQLNGLPSWLDDLAVAHSGAVQEVLGGELTIELRELASVESSGLLTGISCSSAKLKELFRPRLLAWLDEGGDAIREGDNEVAATRRLEIIIEVLLQDVDDAAKEQLKACALSRLGDSVAGPIATAWLTALIRVDPEAGTVAIERATGNLPPAKYGRAVDLFAALFGDRFTARLTLADRPGFSSQQLFRLVNLAYRHIRPTDDNRHEGPYTPNVRDDAQHARNALLDALLRSKGPDGWAIKLALAEEPWFTHMRDRVLSVARELAAQEVDGQPATAAAVVSLERYGDAPPATRDDMFQLMRDRLGDLDDLLMQDGSPREVWAGIKDERVIRRSISRELQVAARGAYTIEQESVTADEKETDIRFKSTISEQEGVIEIKIGEKDRSAADLCKALSDQLVRKYMGPETRRAGVLLITITTDRQWRHPDSGEKIDLPGLVVMLNEKAREIMDALGGGLRVSAHGLDLRPRMVSEQMAKLENGRRSE